MLFFSKINGDLSFKMLPSRPASPTRICFSHINTSSAEISFVAEVSSAVYSAEEMIGRASIQKLLIIASVVIGFLLSFSLEHPSRLQATY
jgi:hypothetical protein|tara:strand:- start:531 stop:800 length:270 start_codon:yes stop_codon:yes gene_type:complete